MAEIWRRYGGDTAEIRRRYGKLLPHLARRGPGQPRPASVRLGRVSTLGAEARRISRDGSLGARLAAPSPPAPSGARGRSRSKKPAGPPRHAQPTAERPAGGGEGGGWARCARHTPSRHDATHRRRRSLRAAVLVHLLRQEGRDRACRRKRGVGGEGSLPRPPRPGRGRVARHRSRGAARPARRAAPASQAEAVSRCGEEERARSGSKGVERGSRHRLHCPARVAARVAAVQPVLLGRGVGGVSS